MAATKKSSTAKSTSKSSDIVAYRYIDSKRTRPWKGEEEVRIAWATALEQATGKHFDAERAKTDLNYNNVIIEFKAPGLFKGSPKSAKFKEAVNQRLLPYIKRAASQTGLPESDFIGIAIDGEHICFAQVVAGKIQHNHLLPFSQQAVGMVIAACELSTRPAVTAENLIKDFGHASPVATAVMQVLADSLATSLSSTESSKISMLFEEWRVLYGQVADLSADQKQSIDQALRFTWNGQASSAMAARLFVIHSYNSLLIKLLAAEIVAAHKLATSTAPAEAMCGLLTARALIDKLESEVEQAGLFTGSGIKGFVQEAIFSWYLDVGRSVRYRDPFVASMKALLGKLALYRTDHLSRQRDALRDFYQDLVPETMRKSLGEFYTPDWLVSFTVAKAAPKKWIGSKILDPACGSGSFLVEVIRQKRLAAEKTKMGASGTLAMLCDEVWGFDLNPLAVQTSRVNFLMEIVDLLRLAPGTEIELPVLLADAIYSPASGPSGKNKVVEYRIGSQVADLNITLPRELALDRVRLDQVFEVMAAHIEQGHEYTKMAADLSSSALVTEAEAKIWETSLRKTYDKVLDLHRKNWNGIWFRIVRNFFWSATAGKFDVILGNPPWVRWSRLPEAYRDRVKPTCEEYDIFSKTKHHGGNELDISAMITYTTADKWLKTGGHLAFVITQTVFQNPSSSGFRNFRINATQNLIPLCVDDLKALKPFADAANKTAVVLFEKSAKKPSYPVSYTVWDAKPKTRTIPPEFDLPQVLARVTRTTLEANPVAGDGSPWAILPKGRFKQLLPMSKPASTPWVEGRKGITADLNGVYFVSVLAQNSQGLVQIKSRPEAGKKDIGIARTEWIEPDWLYPLIKGAADFEACYFYPANQLFAIVPNTGIRQADYQAAKAKFIDLPKTKRYLGHYKALLQDRSTYKGRMKASGAPHYAVYNVGEFTFKPWKVIWAEMSGRFSAAVAGSASVLNQGQRPYVPDHKIFFVAFDDKVAAYFLCGLLNSTVVAEYVESHNVAIQVGDIFKHMRVPTFDSSSASHLALAKCVEAAHAEKNAAKRAPLVSTIRGDADKLMNAWLSSQ